MVALAVALAEPAVAGPDAAVVDQVSVGIETDGVAWDAFLERHPDGTVEHQWGWRRVLTAAFGHDCLYLAARRGGRIVGVLPLVRHRSWLFGRSIISLPFFNYAGIVASDEGARQALVAQAVAIGRACRARQVELRHRDRQLPLEPCQQKKLGFSRALPATTDALWTALDRKVRNQVRKGQKDGLTAESGGDALIDDFYDVFAVNMRDLGTPVFPRRLFAETIETFRSQARVFVIRKGDAPVAGGIAIGFRDTMLVPWASSLREYRQHSPNMLLYWAMMEWAIGRGSTTFDFGRSSIGSGTQQFKEQWGGVGRPLTTEYVLLESRDLPEQGADSPKMQRAIRAWQRLPVAVAKAFGPVITRHLS